MIEMKKILIMLVIVFSSIASQAYAAGGCPDTAEKLQDFQRCMVPMRGEIGTVYRGTLASLTGDNHAGLMFAMNRAPVVAPHVVPVGYGYGQGLAGPMLAVAAAQAYRANPKARIWLLYGLGGMGYPVFYPYW